MNIREIYEAYLHTHADEKKSLVGLNELLLGSSNVVSRTNFDGHVTVGAFILNTSSKQVLLLEHKALQRFLQPGGHIEPTDKTLLEAVMREIREETGLSESDLELRPADATNLEVPFDIDTHIIPANSKKNELEHYHHDFRYLYTTTNSSIEFNPEESNKYTWVNWEDFSKDEVFEDLAEKIDTVLEPNTRDYFKSLVPKSSKNVSVLAVAHIIPSSEDYIGALQENFNMIGIIPKPKSINSSSRKRLEAKGVKIFDDFTRKSIESDSTPLLELLINHDDVCLVDIGGYFSPVEQDIIDSLGNKFLGIIEDTENGYKRYLEKNLDQRKLVSVARSVLKTYEDQLVGHGIAHATETVLRQVNVIITYKKCGIIGYGKVGEGVGEYLQQRNIRPFVSDVDPLRSIQASCNGAIVCDTDELIKNCDVIFCATGAQALNIIKLRDLKRETYLASATSSDDEFDLRYLEDEYDSEVIDPYIRKYYKKGRSFYLLNDGNAINFLYSGAVDKYINLVQGEIVYNLARLKKMKFDRDIITNEPGIHQFIARNWLSYVKRNQ